MKRSKRKPKPETEPREEDAALLPTEEERDDPEALHQAEESLGISEWIDPDTGGPAEDGIPRLEDH